MSSSQHIGMQSDEASNDSVGLLEDTVYLEGIICEFDRYSKDEQHDAASTFTYIGTVGTFDIEDYGSILDQEDDAKTIRKNNSIIDQNRDLKDEQHVAVSTSKHSRQLAIEEYKENKKKKMNLLERKRAELDNAHMLPYRPSSGNKIEENQQKQYTCKVCKKTIKTECNCLSRSLRLYTCNHEELQKGVDLVIDEVSKVRKVYSREKSMKRVKDKLRKQNRANEKLNKQDDGNHTCYNCKLPITSNTETCKCCVISTRIPFNIWADENLEGLDLKQQLTALFENELQRKKKAT
jgi:hypothetical protein